MAHFTRRRLLTVGAVSMGAFAGCSTSKNGPEGVVLGAIELVNATEDTLTFHYLVENSGEIVSWSSREVEPDAGEEQTGFETFVPDVSTDPGSIVVHCRVGDQQATIDFSEEDFDGKCVIGSFVYGFRGDNILSTRPVSVDFFQSTPDWVECPQN